MKRYCIRNAGYTWAVDMEEQVMIIIENNSILDSLKTRDHRKIIRLQDIDEMEVLYNKMFMGRYGQSRNGLVFKVKSKYLDIFTFCAYVDGAYNEHDKKEFLESIKILKIQGVRIVDEYQLIEALRNSNIGLTDYINTIERGNGK